jgi:hypothetical protein
VVGNRTLELLKAAYTSSDILLVCGHFEVLVLFSLPLDVVLEIGDGV